MKKRYLKKWVEVVLTLVFLISLMIIASESYSNTYFITSKLVSLITLFGSAYIITKYGRMVE